MNTLPLNSTGEPLQLPVRVQECQELYRANDSGAAGSSAASASPDARVSDIDSEDTMLAAPSALFDGSMSNGALGELAKAFQVARVELGTILVGGQPAHNLTQRLALHFCPFALDHERTTLSQHAARGTQRCCSP